LNECVEQGMGKVEELDNSLRMKYFEFLEYLGRRFAVSL